MADVKDLAQIQSEIRALDAQQVRSISDGSYTLADDAKFSTTNPVQTTSGVITGQSVVPTNSPANAKKSATSEVDTRTNPARRPWVMTCQSWIENSSKRTSEGLPSYIYFRVNPSEVSWRLPLRATEKKTRSGSVLHVWRRDQQYSNSNSRSTYFDEPQLSITFQSGNIMPILQDKATGKLIVPEGLDNFYLFLELMDEQKILPDGRSNLIYLIINTRIFPSMTLAGIFTPEGTGWTDSADNPNLVNSWTSNFTIYSTYPALKDRKSLIDTFVQEGFGKIQ